MTSTVWSRYGKLVTAAGAGSCCRSTFIVCRTERNAD